MADDHSPIFRPSAFEDSDEPPLLMMTDHNEDEEDYLQVINSMANQNDNSMNRKMAVQIADKSALHCKNGCGFYGNREWDGYCSICYKDIRRGNKFSPTETKNPPQQDSALLASSLPAAQSSSSSSSLSKSIQQKILPDKIMNRAHSATSLSPHHPSFANNNSSSSLSFRKFEEKKRQQSDKKSIKSIFKRASTFREYRSSSATSSQSNATNNDSNNSWQFFSLEKPLMFGFGEEVLAKFFSDFACRDINSHVIKCVEKANKLLNRGSSIEELTELLHDFYSTMENRFQTHPQYKDVDNAQYNQLIDQTEKILMDKLYLNLFARVQSEEEERDLELQKKIRNLNWIMCNHLDIDINLRHPKVKDLMDQAITEIIELDSKHVPYEKLESIVTCSKTIFEMLQINNNAAISADQFLPALVFVIINANPPLLQSNIKFITRFSTPSRLMTGEAGYYFTNLCCATTFIEKISGESLNMSENDFQSYVNGESQPPGYYKQSFMCEPFRIMNANHMMLSDTIKRANLWQEQLEALEKRLENYEESLETKCRAAIDSSKTLIEQHKTYKIFQEDFDSSLLPAHFREMYLKEKENSNTELLVDVETEPEQKLDQSTDSENKKNADDDDDDKNSHESKICDFSTTTEDEKFNDETKMEPIADKLPPPLCPEIVACNKDDMPEQKETKSNENESEL